MPNPTLTFGFLVATLYGTLFHLMFGGGARRLVLFLGAGWAGFVFGHIASVWLGITLFNIGALRFASATLGAIIVLVATHLLTFDRSEKRTPR